MGDWDYYCAICAASLNGPSDCMIGSSSQAALEKRRELIQAKRQELGLRDEPRDVESPEESEVEEGIEESGEVEEDEGANDDAASASDYEYIAYDPNLVSKKSLEWLEPPFCIGVNPDAPGTSKYVQ
jgi:hypothetical protein